MPIRNENLTYAPKKFKTVNEGSDMVSFISLSKQNNH